MRSDEEPSTTTWFVIVRPTIEFIRICFSTSMMFFSFSAFSQTLTTVSYSVAVQPCRLSEVSSMGVMTPSLRSDGARFLTDVGEFLSECVVSCRVSLDP